MNNCNEGCSLPSNSNEIEILIRQLKREIKDLKTSTTATLLTQNGKIAETCTYIKNNLSNYLTDMFDTMNLNGDLDTIITSALTNSIDELEDVTDHIVSIKKLGASGNDLLDDTSLIQTALSSKLNDYSKVIFEKGTYKAKGTIYLYSNTEINLNGSTIQDSESAYNDTIRDSAGLRFLNNISSMSNPGYGQLKNITIENGTFDGLTGGILFGLFHAQNITIKNCTFKNCCMGTHIFDLGGCKDVYFENCKFVGCSLTNDLNYREMIQLDYASYTSVPYWGNNASYSYDDLPCENIKIKGCSFEKGEGTTYPNAIGTHGSRTLQHKNVVIEDNDFYDCTKTCIRFPRIIDLHIIDNRFYATNESVRDGIYCILIEPGLSDNVGITNKNIYIQNNSFISDSVSNSSLIFARIGGSSAYYHKNIIINDNSFIGTFVNSAGSDFLQLGYVQDIIINSNIIEKAKNFIHCVNSQIIDRISILNNRLKNCRTYTNRTGTSQINNIFSKNNIWETSEGISVKQNEIFKNLYSNVGSGSGDKTISENVTNFDYLLLATGSVDNRTYTTIPVYPFNLEIGFRPGEDYLTVVTATGKTVLFIKNETTIEVLSTDDLVRRIIGVKLI